MRDLTGRTVLVLDDDGFVAGYVEAVLVGAGAEVIGPCACPVEAFELAAERRPDAAALHLPARAAGGMMLADQLAALGVPFLFLGEAGDARPPEPFGDRPVLSRPFGGFQVVDAVARLVA